MSSAKPSRRPHSHGGGMFRRGLSRWQLGALTAALLCFLVYGTGATFFSVDPSSPIGLSFGIAATMVLVGVALYAVRRRTARFLLGRSRTWQQFHVYGGLLFLLLVLMHMKFHLPDAGVTWWLFFLSLWVTITGLGGWFLQKWIPRALTSGLRTEVLYERIPELVKDLREQAESITAKSPDLVRDFHRRTLAPAMAGPQPKFGYFVNLTGAVGIRAAEFEYLKRFLGPEDRETLDRLEAVHRTKLELDAHLTLQGALRMWLFLHVPPSVALLFLVAVHIFNVWYY